MDSRPSRTSAERSDERPLGVAGLVLAAGSGSRIGTPKALLRHPSGEAYLAVAIRALTDGGCDAVMVVLGASAEAAARHAVGAEVVHAEHWSLGMGESLRAGLDALHGSPAHAALIMLVDLPDVNSAVVERVLESVIVDDDALARATFHGVPGHPVLIGRNRWADVREHARGDRGARDYLDAHVTDTVECGDLASGRDVDTPADAAGMRSDRDAGP